MQAAVLTKDGFALQSVALPVLQPDEVLIKAISCGVCSGDLFVYNNRADYYQTYNRLGHEASGTVVAVGTDVVTVAAGEIVTALAQPAYSDYFIAPAKAVVQLPQTVDPLYAIGEAVACCVHASWRFNIKPGDKVAVIGCGFMGLVCQQIAQLQGAACIIGVDPIAERRAFSENLGALATYDPTQTDASGLLRTHGDFDVVLECAGVQSAVDLSTELVAIHGRIVLIGYHQSNNGMRTVNMERWNYKAIDIINGHVRNEDEKIDAMRQAVDLMAAGEIVTDTFSTVYPFAEIETAFQDLANRKPGVLKAILQMT